MQDWAPPQYSEDGSWWWNGQRWVPVTWPVPEPARPAYDGAAPERPRRRRTPAVLWVGLIALVLLLVLAAGGSAVGWIAGQGIGALPAAPPTQAPAPTTTGGPATVDDYRQAVVADASRFQSTGQAVADRCAPAALQSGTAD